MALDKTFIYSYNGIGGISSVSEYDYTTSTPSGTPVITSYTYDGTQVDRLASFGGKAITYDANGCVKTYDGWTYTWTRGRLTSMKKPAKAMIGAESRTYTFTYDAYGRRTQKKFTYTPGLTPQVDYVKTETTYYTYDNSGRLVNERCVSVYDDNSTETHEFTYLYDGSGIVGTMFSKNGATATPYYYRRNLQGDVTVIYNQSGTKVAEYAYDAWGNCTVTYSGDFSIAYTNPIRYRGYYYDRGTEFYYLNARYYNPQWRRFISLDSTEYIDSENPNGLNLYAYCNNDPVNYCDPSGHDPEWLGNLLIVGAGVLLIAGLAIATIATGGAAAGVAGAVFAGALKGALIGAAVGTVAGGAIGYAIDGVDGMWTGMAIGFTGGAVIGAVIGGTIGYYNSLIQVDINKFTNYVLDPSNSKGKHIIFKHLGYDKSNAKSLVRIYKKQGLKNYLLKKYSLGKIDLYGQRITMGIKIGDTVLKTGWMLLENGIRLITPFSGFLN